MDDFARDPELNGHELVLISDRPRETAELVRLAHCS